MSSTMRMVMQMMNQQGGGPNDDQYKNTLEINASHPLISKLNLLRKKDAKTASRVAKQFLDNLLVSSGIQFDLQTSTARNLSLMGDYLNKITNKDIAAAQATTIEADKVDNNFKIEFNETK